MQAGLFCGQKGVSHPNVGAGLPAKAVNLSKKIFKPSVIFSSALSSIREAIVKISFN